MNPLVSVVVPIYNVEKYLKRCIDSIVCQSYKNLEIILVDDGSTDNSLSIARKYDDKRIKVLTKANGGLSDARNYGLKYACGEYVSFIDSDDFIEPAMIEKMIELGENSDIIVCDMKYLYDDGSESFASGGNFIAGRVLDNPELITINNSACNKLFKLKMFEDINFPKGKYYEDLATIPSLLYKADRIVKINEPFYVYYQRKGSIAHSVNIKIFEIYDAIDDCISFVKNHGNEKKVLDELYSLYIIHGLDITTLRIKDFDDKKVRRNYLEKNMDILKKKYPNYKNDKKFNAYSFKKKFIFMLLDLGLWELVLKIYDK